MKETFEVTVSQEGSNNILLYRWVFQKGKKKKEVN